MYKCQYFGIKELVSPIVYNQWGEQAWMFFDADVLQDLDTIRETYGKAIIINNWKNNLTQCGLRCNLDPLVRGKNTLYLSTHIRGAGFDLHCTHGHNSKLWEHVRNLIVQGKLKKINGLEDYSKTSGWVHVQYANTNGKIYIF